MTTEVAGGGGRVSSSANIVFVDDHLMSREYRRVCLAREPDFAFCADATGRIKKLDLVRATVDALIEQMEVLPHATEARGTETAN